MKGHGTKSAVPSPLKEFNQERSLVGYPIMLSLGGWGEFEVQTAEITDDYGYYCRGVFPRGHEGEAVEKVAVHDCKL
jgi:hypothetical protein